MQRLALKLLHVQPGQLASRRMARERGLLASLDHPCIARYIDGGIGASGQPYLLMDYIEGQSLHEHLASAPASPRQRLELMLALCDAVQHAHQRLVLHRDLKPSNIMVRADGSPVLLDFGIAVAMSDAQMAAHTVTVAFTPGYGAPEQLRGENVTTATDVFGLGAVLFDLLTGRKLSDLRGRDAPVPSPSSRVDDPALRSALRGDLDRIVLTACAELPGERYATVAALADDLRRYLEGKPVLAAAGGTSYRLRKFVGRHRLATAATAVALIGAGLFVWRLDIERQRALHAEHAAQIARARSEREASRAQASRLHAEREAAHAEASRRYLASVLIQASPDNARGQPLTASGLLSGAAAALQADRAQDPQTRAIAWLSIAEVYAELNDPRAGLRAADAAMALLDQGAKFDADLRDRQLSIRAILLTLLDQHREAMAVQREQIALRERDGADPVDLAKAYSDFANAAAQSADYASARDYTQRALAALDRAATPQPALRAQMSLGLVVVALQAQDLASADRYLGEALSLAKTAWKPDDPRWYQAHMDGSQLRRLQGRHPESLREAEQALRIAYLVYGERSRYTLEAENSLAVLLNSMGRPQAAIEHYERAYAIGEQLDLDPTLRAKLWTNLGAVYAESTGDYRRAIALETAALALMPNTNDEAHLNTARAKAYVTRAVAHTELGQFARAYADLDAADAAAQAINEPMTLLGIKLRRLRTLIRDRRLEPAQRLLSQAMRTVDTGPKAMQNFKPSLTVLSAELASARGEPELAAEQIAQALASAGGNPGYSPLMIANARLIAAQIDVRRGQRDSAREYLRQAVPVLQALTTPGTPRRSEAEALLRQLSD
nr:serine/threonine-protein kinase [Lysobacter capsici]